jgi:hypothetical protein
LFHALMLVSKSCRAAHGANLSVVAGGSRPSGPTPPVAEAVAEAVEWSSMSVVELEAFLRSRGVDRGGEGEGQPDKSTLVEIVMAIAADEQEQQHSHQRGYREGGCWLAPRPHSCTRDL